mmetsp:Transcript_65930/g.124701  ORF Transcript_65930/g.124701 Transcript_65930/m.124701 type:complete len:280 (-) Transcript_65930:41-880(-)
MRTVAVALFLIACLGQARRVHETSRQFEVDKAAEFLASLLPASQRPVAGWHVAGNHQGLTGARVQPRSAASPAHRARISMQQQAGVGSSRRAVLAPLLAAVLATQAKPLPASAALPLKDVKNERYGVSWKVPEGWTAQEVTQEGGQLIVVAPDPEDAETSVLVAFTLLRPDLASMGSVGTSFFTSLFIPSCDGEPCKLKNGDFSEGNLLSDTTEGDKSIYDYTIEQRNGRKERIKTLFTVKKDPAGASSILVGLNVQCPIKKYAALEPTFKEIIASLKK